MTLLLLLVGCTSPSREDGPTVGVILDYTGPEASGFEAERALLLAGQLMADAREGEPPFRFVYRDSRNNPEDARRAAAELVDEGVDVVIGPSTDRLVPTVAEVLAEAGVVLVSPNPTIGDFGTEAEPWFRLSPGNLTGSTTPELIGVHMAREFVKRGAKRALIVSDDDVYNVELVRGFKSSLASRGGKVAAELSATGSRAEEVVATLDREEVDAVVVAMSISPAAALIADVYSRTRTEQNWLLTPRLKSELLTVNTPLGALNGAFGVSLRLPGHDSACSQSEACFVGRMKEVLGREPFENTYFMYDASAVALIALDKVWRENDGVVDRAELSKTILAIADRGGVQIGWNDFEVAVETARSGGEVQYIGVTGAIVFTPAGSRVGGDTIVFEVENYAFVDAPN